MTFQEWKQTENGRQAASDADRMTKEQMIEAIIEDLIEIAAIMRNQPENAQ